MSNKVLFTLFIFINCVDKSYSMNTLANFYSHLARIPNKQLVKLNSYKKTILKTNGLEKNNERHYSQKTFLTKRSHTIQANINNLNKFLNVFKEKTIQIDGNKTICIEKKGIHHILSRHHPRFWDGSIKRQQSFFNKNITLKEIICFIEKIIHQNKDFILQNTDKQYQIQGTMNGEKYVLGINNGKICQFYCFNNKCISYK